ncbi:hypothetical protein WA1_11975 [Scytonema hofmannii PCC 7110]|uniref:Uncharacterized protein n=1 Tax=Scytonema hofmannii PCC 7110 TaxID=128403 RepID=A0A139XDR1_9CYAN|nr:hypothetical protein WA1_11975 [Scytonema hofmannii PCC 7110]
MDFMLSLYVVTTILNKIRRLALEKRQLWLILKQRSHHPFDGLEMLGQQAPLLLDEEFLRLAFFNYLSTWCAKFNNADVARRQSIRGANLF